VAILLGEQNVARVLEIAARAYVLEAGRIVAESASSVLRQQARIEQAYLGRLTVAPYRLGDSLRWSRAATMLPAL